MIKVNPLKGRKRPEHSAWLKEHHPLKGKHHSLETKEKIRVANTLAHKEGRLKADNFRGHHHTEESKLKIGDFSRGKKRPSFSQEWKDGIRKAKLGNQATLGKTWKIKDTSKMGSGMRGKLVSKETIQKRHDTLMKKYGKLGFPTHNTFSNAKRGWYDINGRRIFFRSLWEANYALYIDFLKKKGKIKEWEFEVDTFWFEKIKRGVRSYMPDFKIWNNDGTFEYHEVKGWMNPKSITKLKRMKKYYPHIKVVVIDKDDYKQLKNNLGAFLKFY